MLAEQVEQRGFGGGDGVDGDAKVESLLSAAGAVARGELRAHGIEHGVVVADGLADHQFAGILEGLADLFAARDFADAGVARAVGEDEDVAGEERSVRAAEVEQHRVVAGNGHHAQIGNDGGRGRGRGKKSHGSLR